MEFIIKIDQRKKEAKGLLDYLKSLPYVQLNLESENYDPDFVATINKRETDIKNGKSKLIRINPKDVWQNIL